MTFSRSAAFGAGALMALAFVAAFENFETYRHIDLLNNPGKGPYPDTGVVNSDFLRGVCYSARGLKRSFGQGIDVRRVNIEGGTYDCP